MAQGAAGSNALFRLVLNNSDRATAIGANLNDDSPFGYGPVGIRLNCFPSRIVNFTDGRALDDEGILVVVEMAMNGVSSVRVCPFSTLVVRKSVNVSH